MKIILSRKGFDSSAGGCPSPILPDGRLLTLPIPDSDSLIRYGDIDFGKGRFGKEYDALLSHLTRGRMNRASRAHLDPDLEFQHLPRQPGWRPVLGQSGAAQGHLRKQGVGVDDLFLFFGLFRPVERHRRRWRFVPGSRARHVIWGWMQIAEVLQVDELKPKPESEYQWLNYHPHLQMPPDPNNTLYIARKQLSTTLMTGSATAVPGSGVFTHWQESLQLTGADSVNPSQWQLPVWFYPDQRTPLTYHQKMERWQLAGNRCLLQCAARGQEFVLDSEQYPESLEWLQALITAV